MNKCIDCQNETICTGNQRKGSHANCFQPKRMTNFERKPNQSLKYKEILDNTKALAEDPIISYIREHEKRSNKK